MAIEVTCIECGTSHRVNQRLAGRRVRCPKCDTVVHVPEAGPTSADEGSADPQDGVDEINEEEVLADESFEAAPVIHGEPIAEAPLTEPQETRIVILDDQDDDDVLPRSKRQEQDIDMTPMVDVTFLLLIFFMVTAAFSLQKSIQMPRQQTDAPSTNVEQEVEDLDLVEVQIDEFGSFLVMAPEWERETPGKQNLITALREAIANAKDGMRLRVKVHEMAKLRSLVDAMDAGTIAGFSELEVKQVEDFD